ncbi:MAG: PQQ-binding-like beta-propeller repeat protein [Pirellulales bacterium]
MCSRLFRAATALLMLACLALPAQAQEWTRFRGPNGSGISDATTVPTTWTEADYNWRVELPGIGHSSPVIWKDKIFLTSTDEDKLVRCAFCLSRADGGILWKKEYPFEKHKRHEYNSYSSATPAVDEQRVYVVWSTPDDYSLLAFTHDGREVWKRNLGPYKSQHSCGTSPIVFQDMVIVGNDQDGPSSLIAVDRETGEKRWEVERKASTVAYSTPCIYEPAGESPELIFNSQAHGISGINPINGATIWEVGDVFNKRSVSSPVIVSGLIYGSCGSGGGGNYIVAVTPGSMASPSAAKLAYKLEKSAPYVPTPIGVGRNIFFWSEQGVVSCVDAPTGEVHYQERVGGKYFGSPICVADRLFNMTTDGEVVVVAAKPAFEELARNPSGEMSHATPAVSDGVMYLRTLSHLISVGGSKATGR